MKNDQWEAIQAVFEKMEQACGQLGSPVSPVHSPLQSAEVSTIVGEEEVSSAPDQDQCHEVVGARSEIRTQLDFLRVKLAETLAERDCYLVLFPIVAYFDEHVQTRYLDENQLSWPPLQKELFQIDDAGELFYETVDDLLRKPQTIPFIYEVYYFCLNQGFQGKYVDNPVKISEYMKKLRGKYRWSTYRGSNQPRKKRARLDLLARPYGTTWLRQLCWFSVIYCSLFLPVIGTWAPPDRKLSAPSFPIGKGRFAPRRRLYRSEKARHRNASKTTER